MAPEYCPSVGARPSMLNGSPYPSVSGRQQLAAAISTPGKWSNRCCPSRTTSATAAVLANRAPATNVSKVRTFGSLSGCLPRQPCTASTREQRVGRRRTPARKVRVCQLCVYTEYCVLQQTQLALYDADYVQRCRGRLGDSAHAGAKRRTSPGEHTKPYVFSGVERQSVTAQVGTVPTSAIIPFNGCDRYLVYLRLTISVGNWSRTKRFGHFVHSLLAR